MGVAAQAGETSTEPGLDSGLDSGPDSGLDSGLDSGPDSGRDHDPTSHPSPAWVLALVGWLAGVTFLAWRDVPPEPRSPGPDCTLQDDPLPPPPPGPRAWRSVKGIGSRRALAISRALWEIGASQGAEFDLSQVEGVGPVLAARGAPLLETMVPPCRTPLEQGLHSINPCVHPPPDRLPAPPPAPPDR